MNRLKELRKEKSLTQKSLADEMGVTKRTIIAWENGERDIKFDKAQQLADFFGVSVGYLLGFESNQDGCLGELLEEIKEIRQYACMVAGFNQVFIPENEVISVFEKHIKSLKKRGVIMELEHYEDNNIWRRRYMDLLDEHVELHERYTSTKRYAKQQARRADDFEHKLWQERRRKGRRR